MTVVALVSLEALEIKERKRETVSQRRREAAFDIKRNGFPGDQL